MMNVITGYILVRKASEYFEFLENGKRWGPPCVGSLCYSGINRDPWFDLNVLADQEEDWAKEASEWSADAGRIIKKLENEPFNKGLDMEIAQDLNLAKEALRLLRFAGNDRNEIICLYSREAEQRKSMTSFKAEVEWLGLDLFTIGGWWSLLEHALYGVEPDLVRPFMNENGLIPDMETATALERNYRVWMQDGRIEPLEGLSVGIVTGWVGRPV